MDFAVIAAPLKGLASVFALCYDGNVIQPKVGLPVVWDILILLLGANGYLLFL